MLARSLGRALLHRSQTRLQNIKVAVALGSVGVVAHARRSGTSSSANDATTGSSSSSNSSTSISASVSSDQTAETAAVTGSNASRRRSRKLTPHGDHATSLAQAPAATGAAAAAGGTTEASKEMQTSEHSSSAAGVDSEPATANIQPLPAAAHTAGAGTVWDPGCVPPAASAAPSLSELLPVPSQQELAFPDSSFELRDYQQEAIKEVVKQWKAGSSVQLVMLPTGTGKTVVFAALARYISQHYVHSVDADAAAVAGGVGKWGAAPMAAAVAAVVTQEQGAVTGQIVESAAAPAPAATAAEQHVAADGGGEGATGTAAAAAAGNAGSSIAAPAYADSAASVSFRTLRRRKGNNEEQQQLAAAAAAANASQLVDVQADHSSSTLDNSAAAAVSSTSSRTRSLGAGSAGSSDQAVHELASSSIDDSSSSKRGRPRIVRTCAPGLMRVLVLAHRFELLHQAEEKFGLVWPGCSVSWVKGQRKDFFGQVVVASVGTAVNCIPQLAQCDFSLVVLDEAHHSVANTYKAVLRGLGFVEEVAVASNRTASSSSSSSDGAGGVEVEAEAGVDTSAALRLSERRREWKKQYEESGVEPDDAVLGLQALPYADAPDYSSSSSSSSSASQAESSQDWGAAAGLDGGGSSSSSSSSGGAAESEQVVMRALNNPNSLCVGFTATPYRMREAESSELYEIFTNVFSRNISDMIKAGHLTKIHSRKIFTHVHLKGAGGYGGDFITSKLSPLVNSRGRNNLVLAAFLDYCCEPDAARDVHNTATAAAAAAAAGPPAAAEPAGVSTAGAQAAQLVRSSNGSSSMFGQEQDDEEEVEPNMKLSMAGKQAVRKAIGFAVDIEHAEALNALFLQAGVRSAVVHSKRSVDEVKLDISRFRKGALDVLWNCEKLTEGFDEPSINALLLARPTKSTGLYTQMLGRGLRRAPGKDNCLVLDFTDKQHKVDRIIDLRVLLPDGGYRNLDPNWQPPEQKDKTRRLKLEGQQGGEMSVLGDEVNPYDMAFVRIGEHWSISMFESGTVWLVNIAGMSAKQRQQLGLLQDDSHHTDSTAATATAAAADGDDDTEQAAAEDGTGPATAADRGSEDDDDSAYVQEDRFVVLHQQPKNWNPFTWSNVAPSAKHGMTESDAYGKAVDYMQSLVRQQQAQAVRNPKQGWQRYGAGKGKPAYFPKFETYSKNASWRTKAASESQLKMLTQLGVELPPSAAAGRMSRGEASDMISQAKGALATQQQLQQLQAKMTAQHLADLPVPLLAEHAVTLGAPRSSSSLLPHTGLPMEPTEQPQVPAVQPAMQLPATTDSDQIAVRPPPRGTRRRPSINA